MYYFLVDGIKRKILMPHENENQQKPIELAGLPDYLGYQIRQAQTAAFRDIEAKMKTIGVTPGEFGLLTIVNANPGINQKTLTGLYGLDKSTLSYAVNRLVDRKWINSKRDPEDGRYFGLWLTAVGRKKAGAATAHIEKQENLMDAVLAKGERQQLLSMLIRISAILKPNQ
jgi:DNA-binding MarR family transcriptional regulator